MPLKSERDQTDVRESVSIKVASSRVVQQDTKAFPVSCPDSLKTQGMYPPDHGSDSGTHSVILLYFWSHLKTTSEISPPVRNPLNKEVLHSVYPLGPALVLVPDCFYLFVYLIDYLFIYLMSID